MISKKTNKADLEKKKPIFFEIGLTIALALALIAFEFSPKETAANNYLGNMDDSFIDDIEMIITEREKIEELIKPKAIQFEIVENTAVIDEPDFDLDPEIDPDEGYIWLPDTPEEDPVEEDTFFVVEEMPEYRNGGLGNFHKHIQESVEYPQTAMEMGLEGTVIISFVVDKKGNVTSIKILRSIDPLLDNEVIAAIEKSDKWKPGRQTGRPVNVSMVIPVAFELQ